MSTSTTLTTIATDSLDQITGGQGKTAPPPKVMSIDATNGLGELLGEKLGFKPPANVINGTKVSRETHETAGKILSLGKR